MHVQPNECESINHGQTITDDEIPSKHQKQQLVNDVDDNDEKEDDIKGEKLQTNGHYEPSRKRSRSLDDHAQVLTSDDKIVPCHVNQHQKNSITSPLDNIENESAVDVSATSSSSSNNSNSSADTTSKDCYNGNANKLRKTEISTNRTDEPTLKDRLNTSTTQSIVIKEGNGDLLIATSQSPHREDYSEQNTVAEESLLAQQALVSHSNSLNQHLTAQLSTQSMQPSQPIPPLILHRPSTSRGPRGPRGVPTSTFSSILNTSCSIIDSIPEYIIDDPATREALLPPFSCPQSIERDKQALNYRQSRQPIKWPTMAEPFIRQTACRRNERGQCLLEIKSPSVPRQLLDRIDVDVVIVVDALFYEILNGHIEEACRSVVGNGGRVRVYWICDEIIWDESSQSELPKLVGSYSYKMELDKAIALASSTQCTWAANWESMVWQNEINSQSGIFRSCTILICGTGSQPALDNCVASSVPTFCQSGMSEKVFFQAPIHTIGCGGRAPHATLFTLSKMTGGVFQVLQRDRLHILEAVKALIVKIRTTTFCNVSVQVDCMDEAEFQGFCMPAMKSYDQLGSNPLNVISLGDMWSDEQFTIPLQVSVPSRDIWGSDDEADYEDFFDDDITPYLSVTVWYVPIIPSSKGPVLRKTCIRACYIPSFSTMMQTDLAIALERNHIAQSIINIFESLYNRPRDWSRLLDKPVRQILEGYERRRQNAPSNRTIRKQQLGQLINWAETLEDCLRHFHLHSRDASEEWIMRFWTALSMMYNNVMERNFRRSEIS